jgi:hypothetical protein
MSSDYEIYLFLNALSLIMDKLNNVSGINNFEYFLLFLFKDHTLLGTM